MFILAQRPMKLLAIETATDACSAAIIANNQIYERFALAPRKHSELILQQCEAVLTDADLTLDQLDALAFGCGPGAFTGLRIGCSVIQGIALATQLPVVPVSTLAATAHGVWRQTQKSELAVAIDARMGEVYWGAYQIYDAGAVSTVGQECVCHPSQVTLPDEGKWFGVGSGWSVYQTILQARCQPRITGFSQTPQPSAQDIAIIGRNKYLAGLSVTADQALPVYLRNKVVSSL